MLNYILVVVFAIIMALFINFIFILLYADKILEYLNKKQNKSFLVKILDFLFRVSVPITFGVIVLYFPSKITKYFAHGKLAENLETIYLIVFAILFGVIFALHIKQGKIKCVKGK